MTMNTTNTDSVNTIYMLAQELYNQVSNHDVFTYFDSSDLDQLRATQHLLNQIIPELELRVNT